MWVGEKKKKFSRSCINFRAPESCLDLRFDRRYSYFQLLLFTSCISQQASLSIYSVFVSFLGGEQALVREEDTQVSENQAQVTDIRAIRQERNTGDSFW